MLTRNPLPGLSLLVVLLASAHARGDDEAGKIEELRREVEQSIAEGHLDQIDDHLELAMRKASMANRPVRLGRIELFAAELDAERPTDKVAERAHKAVLHLGEDPMARFAELRWHVTGGQSALAAGRLGGTALHLQQAREALSRVEANLRAAGTLPRAADGKLPLGTTDPRRDRARLEDVERGLLARLRAGLQERGGDVASLPVGHQAALAALATGEVLRPDCTGNEPLPPRGRPSSDGILGKLDRFLSGSEEREIAGAEARGDARQAALVRMRHAETLVRIGRVADAIAVRRESLAFYRDSGTLDQVMIEARWIADHADKNPRAMFAARRESVRELQRGLLKLVGPARAAAANRHRGEVVALVEGAAQVAALPGQRAGLELLEPVDLVRDRSAWDEVNLFADGPRWRRLGAAAADLSRQLEAIAKDDQGHGSDALSLVDNLASPMARARQKASEAMARGEQVPAEPPSIDAAAIGARVGSRALVIYGRLDPSRLAIGVMARGVARVIVTRFALDDEVALMTSLRRGLREGGDDWHAPAQKLYNALVAPIEPLLGDGMIIVPDGTLVAAPLGALESPAGQLLAELTTIVFSPSLLSLSAPRDQPLASRASLLYSVARFAEPGARPLPFAERGVRALKAVLAASGRPPRLLPAGATPAQLLAEVGPYDVIHVQSRLRLDGEMPVVGALLTATAPLFACDLARLAVRGNLLVLDTPGITREVAPLALARGLTGLIGGALAWPARSLVVAVQVPESAAGAALFSRLYERYAAGESPSLALANAQREMASGRLEQPLLLAAGADPLPDSNRFVHPRYWAGYAAWGEP